MAEIKLDMTEFNRRVTAMAEKLPAAVRVGVLQSLQLLSRDVVLKISGPYLGVVTGTARRSIRAGSVLATPQSVEGGIGSPLGYVRAHEKGFRGTVAVRAHARRKGAKTARGRTASRKAFRAGKAGQVMVRAHTRKVHMRARHFFRDALRENVGKVDLRIKRALLVLARTGEVPSGADVAGAFRA